MSVGQEVEIADVERELTRLWREAAQSGQASAALLRACALNLVVAGCDGEPEDAAQILAEVTARHPCRAILIRTDEETAQSPAQPRAWVSMVCHRGGRGQPQVCSEQVVLVAPSAALHELVASVAGLLVADLPTVLWWRGRPPQSGLEEERFDHLADVADRVLLDSMRYDAAQLERAIQLARAYPRLPFGDLNWARLTPWRAAVAQCFDPPAAQAVLSGLQKARIVLPGGDVPVPTPAARLLVGWLRSRLRQSLAVEFAAGDADLLELHSADACFRIPRPSLPGDAAALSEELRLPGRDPIFEQALESAQGFVTNSTGGV